MFVSFPHSEQHLEVNASETILRNVSDVCTDPSYQSNYDGTILPMDFPITDSSSELTPAYSIVSDYIKSFLGNSPLNFDGVAPIYSIVVKTIHSFTEPEWESSSPVCRFLEYNKGIGNLKKMHI